MKITLGGESHTLTPEQEKKIMEIIRSKDQDAKAWLLDQFKDCRKDFDFKRWNGWLFIGRKNGNLLLEYNVESGHLNFSYTHIYLILRDKFQIKEHNIKDFVTGIVEEHFGWKIDTTCGGGAGYGYDVEEHFGWKIDTTILIPDAVAFDVEEHFGWKIDTTGTAKI